MTKTVRLGGWVAAAVASIVLASPRPATGQPRASDAAVSTVTHELMSPFCPGLLLADCRSDGARVLRAEIARRIDAGETPDAIESDLVTRFGPEIRTVPEFRGLGILAWIGPLLAGAGGLTVVVVAIQTATAPQPDGNEADGPDGDDALRERIEDELAALE
jgi:cytochrome c-type biogenesis protein CcmH/NrfF